LGCAEKFVCFQHPDSHYACLLLRNENFVFVRVFSYSSCNAAFRPFFSLLHCYFHYSYVAYARRAFLFSLALTAFVCCRGFFLLQMLALANLWPWLLFGFALLNPFHSCLSTFTRSKCVDKVSSLFFYFLSMKFSVCRSQGKLN